MLHFLLSFCKFTPIEIESTTTHSYFYPINRMMKSSLLLILNSLKSHLSGGIHKFIVEYGHGNYLNQTCFKTATWVLRQRLEKAIIRDGEAPPNKVLVHCLHDGIYAKFIALWLNSGTLCSSKQCNVAVPINTMYQKTPSTLCKSRCGRLFYFFCLFFASSSYFCWA